MQSLVKIRPLLYSPFVEYKEYFPYTWRGLLGRGRHPLQFFFNKPADDFMWVLNHFDDDTANTMTSAFIIENIRNGRR